MQACTDYFASFAPTVVKIMLLFSEATTVGADTSAYLHTLVRHYETDATGRDNTLWNFSTWNFAKCPRQCCR